MEKVLCRYFTSYSHYTCEISSQFISSQQLEVVGFHEICEENSGVERLTFVSCTFDKFPRNLYELFPNLSVLWITHCKLESISREDISGLRRLQVLGVINCGLKSLEGDLLRDLKQLESVSFYGNQLSEIGPDILDGLQHLTRVSFLGNDTIDMRFNSSSGGVSLDALKNEIKLKCNSKGSQQVKCEFFVRFSRYQCQVSAQQIPCLQLKFAGEHKDDKSAEDVDELCFEKCTFDEFPKNLHELFPKMSILRMQNCTFIELNCKQINELENLQHFYLQYCNVKNFKGEILNDLKQLARVSLRGNRIEKVELETKKSKRILELLNGDAFKDFTINVGEASFKIHKLLFAAHSATLSEFFKNNPEAVELNLQDIPEAIFEIIYDFVYSEKLPENFDNWTELFMATNRLKIDKLVKITVSQLENSITDAGAQSLLELANKLNNEDLREAAFEHLTKKNFPNKNINRELSKKSEKMKEFIETKVKLDHEYEEVMKKMKKLDIDISQS